MMKRYISSFFAIAFIFSSCENEYNKEKLDTYFQSSPMQYNHKLTDVIVGDIFTPPVASRIYAYANIAAYEGIKFQDSLNLSLASQLNELENLPTPEQGKAYYYPLVSIVAFTEVAQSLVFDLERVQEIQKKLLNDVQEIGIDQEVYKNSVNFGKTIGKHILQWAKEDGYNQRTALPLYSVTDDPGRWRPTPPGYMDAIEPHWNTLRPFVLDSVQQFDPGPPTPFDTNEGSKFYEEAMEVYSTVKELSPDQVDIAKFWDCNPNISVTQGHVMYFKQKISPGGHWMHITTQAMEDLEGSLSEKQGILAVVSITLADAFISCWDQKYKSNLIRPETYINTYIDPNWEPILQTPAFPEHTSGHSVASMASATVLTELVSAQYAFIDSTEVPYGLPKRSYESFNQAAEEAAISRLYGGIHYRPAIVKGLSQGKAIGGHILNNIKLR
ncbi:vanadium-dependent haloperoxidase [Christiangramia crocea]|uniref:Vanadium-dependent haloperoxidase n=1 Tax=Christiangramia crocea TaxID=2904124 RepID=A0A9X2A7C5_9FLAO|nr:vanadium-dependent haloperoxidase [Gramella crocea]MCG9970638.1 vanadium-dependent haloperoxidase [Gramella crocea]